MLPGSSTKKGHLLPPAENALRGKYQPVAEEI
jgi:hypothetical protein